MSYSTQDGQINLPEDREPLPPMKEDMRPSALAFAVGHCSGGSVIEFPHILKEAAPQGTLQPTIPEHKPGDPVRFEYAEHRWLGDALELPEHDGGNPSDKAAKYNPLTLANGLSLKYGEINGLAGDFFGSERPICLGTSPEERKARFQEAYRYLAESPIGKDLVPKLVEVLQAEVDAVNKSQQPDPDHPPEDPYAHLKNVDVKINELTAAALKSGLTYLEIAQKNLDHFGQGARRAYDTGHAWALEVASAGTKDALLQAYVINAFADHFLEDSFASGHLRVPREYMVDGVMPNVCAKLMHDEDNRLGVFVSQPDGKKTWTAYGDKHLLQGPDKENKEQCFLALNASVKEVYQAYTSKTTIPPEQFQAWASAASADSVMSRAGGNHAPLFRVFDGVIHCRKVLTTVDMTDRVELAKDAAWNQTGYDPVVTDKRSWLGEWDTTVCWAYLAYNLSPSGTIKDYVLAWLKEKLPWWIVEIITSLGG